MKLKLLLFVVGLLFLSSFLTSSKVLADNSDPSISITPDTSVVTLFGDSVRIWIQASDPDPQDTITVEKTYGTGTYDPRTELAPISDEFYFHPDTSGIYTFIFPVTDEQGASSSDTTHMLVCVVKVDFRQSANKDAPYSPGDIHWINSILQASNSQYYEGMSTLQRIVFIQIPKTSGHVHTLNFSHQANKATFHAYDFLTSWPQGVQAGTEIGGPTMFVNLNECGPEIGPPADMGAICTALHASGFTATPNAPDAMGTLLGDNVASKVTAYEANLGNRTVKIYGNTPISAASLAFTGYSGSTDKYANYTLTWTSSSDSIVIEMAGHLAAGTDPMGQSGVGYGIGRGSSNISGGPYHFKLSSLDGNSIGSQDNQIKGADIFCHPPICNITPSVNDVCDGGSATFTDNTTSGAPPYTYCWTKRPYSDSCLSFTSTLTISNATVADADSYRVIVTDTNNFKDTCYAVLLVNSPPMVSVPEAETVWAGNTLSFNVTATDADPLDTLTLTKTGPGDFSYTPGVSPIMGIFSWTPTPGDTLGSPHMVIFQVADNCGRKSSIADTCTIVVLANNPPQVNCPNTQNHHINTNYTISQVVADDDNQITSLTAYFTGGGVTNLTLTNVQGIGTKHATADVNYDVTNHCAAGGFVWVIAIDNFGAADTCFFGINMSNSPPVLTCPANDSVQAGNKFTSGNYSVTDPDVDTAPVTLLSIIPSATNNPTIVGSYVEWNTTCAEKGDYTIKLLTTDPCGAKDTCQFTVKVYNQPPVLTCTGDEITCDSTLASAIVTSNPSTGVSYLWTPAPVSGQGTAHARYNAPGNKKVVVTIIANGCRKDSCEAVITQNVTKPVLSCSGDELTCDSTLASAIVTSNPSTGVTYLWTPAPVTGQGTAHARYNAPGNKKVVVTITATGCKDSCEAVITQNVTKPVLSCSGDELTCDSTFASAIVTSNPSTGVTYLWTPAPVSGQGTAHARYDAPGNKKAVVTITATGCKDSCEAVITQTVTKPVLSCSGDELTCDSTFASAIVTSNPSTGVTYLWTPAPVTGQGTAHARYNASGTKKVVVTITATGCKDSCNAVITQNVTKPVLSCSGDELTCDSTFASAIVTSNPSTGVTYLWTPAPVSGQGTAHARYDAPGTKWVVVTITATGCKDSCNAVITQTTTKPVLSCSGDELTCDSTFASAIVTSNPSVGVSYLWTPAPVSGQGTTHARYDAPGTKWVVVTITATGCKDSCNAVITQNMIPPSITCPDSMIIHNGHQSSGNFTVTQPQGDSIIQVIAWVTPTGTGITNLTVSGGTGRTPTTGHVEFDANCSYPGSHIISLEATDKCGLKDTCSFQVRIYNQPPQLTCPANGSVHAGNKFTSGDFFVTDPDGDTAPVTFLSITPSATNNPTIVGNHVEWNTTCVENGDYTIQLVATDPCGLKDTCQFTVNVYNQPPQLTCPDDGIINATQTFISTNFSVTDPDGDVATVTFLDITPSVTYNPTVVTSHVEWMTTISEYGDYIIRLVATDPCGLKDTCQFKVTVYNEHTGELVCPEDDSIHAGLLFTSTNYSVSGPGANPDSVRIISITPPPAHQPIKVQYHVEWQTECSDAGKVFAICLEAKDDFGDYDTCCFHVTVYNRPPQLTCPNNGNVHSGTTFTSTNFSVTDPDGDAATVTLVGITPPVTNNPIIVGSHVEWLTTCNEKGIYTIRLLATDPCGLKDTCEFTINVYNQPPVLTCPNNGTVHAGQKFTSSNYSVSDPESDPTTVTYLGITPGATNNPTIVNSHVEWNTTCAENGNYLIRLVATDACGLKDTCEFTVNVYNHPPELTCPVDGIVGQGALFTSGNFQATDPEGGVTEAVTGITPPATNMPYIVGTKVKWFATFNESGFYTITLKATDECGLFATCTFVVEVTVGTVGLDFQVNIGTSECVNPGQMASVPIILKNTPAFGGFELEVDFDFTAMTFVGVDRNQAMIPDEEHKDQITGKWFEKFAYRLLPCPICGCCKYKILLFGMYDLPNGIVGRPIPATTTETVLLTLHFVVNNDENLRGMTIPVCWEWEGTLNSAVPPVLTYDWDCAENTFSDVSGNTLYTSNLTCQYNALPECDAPGAIVDTVNFQVWNNVDHNCYQICGGVQVCDTEDSLDCKRGDINLNTMPYEVADAVLFASYFAQGIVVFDPDPAVRALQICATDVNADGRTLTLSDLVYLIRVILHDAVVIPKLAPSSVANVIVSNGTITVEGANIGAILFEFDSAVNPTLLANGMEMVAGTNKVLVYMSPNTGNSLDVASQVISYTGDAKLVSVEAVDRDTRVLTTAITAKVAPTTFALHPAYPNPFNPFTNLSFTLPEAANYSMKIYNVAGQLVRAYEGVGSTGMNVITWDGKDNAGNSVSSGVYFYKLTSGKFSAIEKMVMMK